MKKRGNSHDFGSYGVLLISDESLFLQVVEEKIRPLTDVNLSKKRTDTQQLLDSDPQMLFLQLPLDPSHILRQKDVVDIQQNVRQLLGRGDVVYARHHAEHGKQTDLLEHRGATGRANDQELAFFGRVIGQHHLQTKETSFWPFLKNLSKKIRSKRKTERKKIEKSFFRIENYLSIFSELKLFFRIDIFLEIKYFFVRWNEIKKNIQDSSRVKHFSALESVKNCKKFHIVLHLVLNWDFDDSSCDEWPEKMGRI